MGQINTNNYPTVNSLSDADLLIVENATNGTGTTTPKQLRENAIGTDTLQTSAQTVTGAINELKGEIDAGAGVVCYDVNAITSGYLGGQFSGSANLLLLHLTTDGTADATNGYMMMLSYTRPVARFAYGRLVDSDGVAYKQDVYADNTIICKISDSGTGTESDPEQVVILGIINAGFMLTPTAVVSDRDIIDGQGNTLSVLAEALTKTASGNPVVISDCAGGKARSLKTTIEAIQDLHGYDHPWAGGAGKNKWPFGDFNGTYSDVPFSFAAGTYTVSKTNPDVNCGLRFFYADDTSIAFTFFTSQTFTLTADVVKINYSSADATTENFMIESGSTATSFAPYSNICPISGRTEARVDDVGKNLANMSDAEIGTAWNGAPNTARARLVIPCKANTAYTMSINGTDNMDLMYVNDSATIPASSAGETFTPAKTFTTKADSTYIIIGFNKANISQADVNALKLQLELGSSKTSYVPYHETVSVTLQLGTTVYGADINWDTGVMTVTHVATSITGDNVSTVSAQSATDTDGGKRININITDAKYCGSGTGLSDIISDRLSVTSANSIYNGTTPNCIAINDAGGIVLRYAGAATVEAAKTALNANPVQACYQLATPIELTLTPTQLEMLKGYNRVTIDNGSIELGYIAKLT